MELQTGISSATLERVRIHTGITADLTEIPEYQEIVPIPITRRQQWELGMKRLLDVSGAVMLLTLLTIVIPVIPLALLGVIAESLIRRSWASPFFGQWRVGQNGVRFKLWKFRSMEPNAESKLPALEALNQRDVLFKMKKDPRVLWVGRILRSTSIDELPQLWNVLRGDMSLIGPRPHLQKEWDALDKLPELRKYLPLRPIILSRRPGLSGMAQTHGRDGNSFGKEITLDVLYIRKWTLLVDIRLSLLTPLVLIERPLQDVLAMLRPVLKDEQDVHSSKRKKETKRQAN